MIKGVDGEITNGRIKNIIVTILWNQVLTFLEFFKIMRLSIEITFNTRNVTENPSAIIGITTALYDFLPNVNDGSSK